MKSSTSLADIQMDNKRMKVSSKHWNLLLNILKEHPEMVTCQNARQKSNELWEAAASKLNALGLGEKTADKWKIALQDWKYKTKIKIAEKNEQERKTGGGPAPHIKINDQEERLLKIIGWSAVYGNPKVPESGLGFQIGKTVKPDNPCGSNSTNPSNFSEVTEEEIIILCDNNSTVEHVIAPQEKRPSTIEHVVVTPQQKRPREESSKKKNPDQLELFQQETMEVLLDISRGIKVIGSELSSISKSLAVIAAKEM